MDISKADAFDRWIESLQILAGDEDNPTEEQRGAMAATRRKMLGAYRETLFREAASKAKEVGYAHAATEADRLLTVAIAEGLRQVADKARAGGE